MTQFELSQYCGLVAFIFDICSFQFKHKRNILLCFAASSLFLGVHYLLLESQTAGLLLLLVSLPRFVIAAFSEKTFYKIFFIILSIVIGLVTYHEPVNALANIASIVVAVASFQKSDKQVRQIMMCGTSLWLLHNYIIKTPVGVLIELFFLTSNFVGYYRYYLRAKY